MHVTNEEVVHMKGNIGFLSSWAKCLIIVNACPWKLLACADGSKHVVWGKFKRLVCEKQTRQYILFGREFLMGWVSWTWLTSCEIRQVDGEQTGLIFFKKYRSVLFKDENKTKINTFWKATVEDTETCCTSWNQMWKSSSLRRGFTGRMVSEAVKEKLFSCVMFWNGLSTGLLVPSYPRRPA